MSRPRDFLGPYRLARLIRVGNSCSVWEAIKEGEEQRYALKVLRSDVANNKEEIGYLKHEFDVAHALRHPNIIRVYEYRTDSKTPFLVLELFSEHNMKVALRDNGHERLSFFAKGIIEQSAEALYQLHLAGWVHCDVKPDNLLVSRTGEVKLIDFTISQKIRTGLSKLFGGSRGATKGTRSYMSPEQIRGKSLDGRADVYSFGCVMFELLTGRPPYTGSTPDELLQKHLTSQIPSVQVHNSNVSDEVTALIRSAMGKSVSDRPDTMWDLLRHFRQLRLFKKAPKKTELSLPETAQSEDE